MEGSRDLVVTLLASSTAGLMARLALHPLDSIKANLQTPSPVPVRQLLSRNLYSGLGVAALGSVPAGCLYFTSYEQARASLGNDSLSHFAAGMFAETLSCLLWVPVDVIKERLQVQQHFKARTYSYSGGLDALKTILRDEGLHGLYRGYGATLASFGPFSAFYFVFYEHFKSNLSGRFDSRIQFAEFACSGALAGALAALITNPLDMAKLRLQIQRAKGDFGPYTSFPRSFETIVKVEGWSALWKGAGMRMAFHAPSTAISITLFEEMKLVWDKVL
jgi:hypothetical protein